MSNRYDISIEKISNALENKKGKEISLKKELEVFISDLIRVINEYDEVSFRKKIFFV